VLHGQAVYRAADGAAGDGGKEASVNKGERQKDDLFEHVSVHAVVPGGHAEECVGPPPSTALVRAERYCIVRFVHGSESGWPMKDVAPRLVGGYAIGGLGWNDEARVAVFHSIEEATAAMKQLNTPPRCDDHVVPLSALTWRVLLFSHYDLSCHLAYRGQDYDDAEQAFGRMCAAKASAAANGSGASYLEAIIEGVVVRAKLPELVNAARCAEPNEKGERCYRQAGHEPPHKYVVRRSAEQLAESKRVSDLLHPDGRCTCAGEGTCEWCRTHCLGCGVRIVAGAEECADCRRGRNP
jgi:hypothetical protein